MKKRITITALLLCTMCAAGCSSTTEQTTTDAAAEAITTRTEAEATASAETTTTAKTTAEITTVTEATTVITEATTTAAVNSEEEQMAIDIARNGYTALLEEDIEGILEYVNLDAIYYLGTGEWVSDEKLTEQYKEATGEDDNNIFTWVSQVTDVEFLYAEHVTEEELQEYNDFIPEVASTKEVNYCFEDAYKVFISYSQMSESEKALIGTDEGVHFLIVKADGKWKLDYFVSIMKDIMDSVYEMAGSETEITTTAAAVPSEAELMTIGSDSLGYMDIPSDWLTFFDPSTYGMNSVQYSSPDLQSIITMVSYDMTLVENGIVTEEQLPSLDPYSMATGSYSLLTESGYQSVEAATVTLDGRTCYQVYGFLEENGGQTMLVAWYFTGDDGYTRYICFESPMDISLEVCAYIEGSYRL